MKKYYCKYCGYMTELSANFKKHILSETYKKYVGETSTNITKK